MSFGKEIKNKMASINNTQKITKAMEMISISKFRKIQIKLNMFQPYCQIIKRILSQIIQKNIEYKYICTEPKKFEQIGIIVISTDKGLCGSLNSNLFKKVSKNIKKYQNKNIKCYLVLIGLKGLNYFKSFHNNIIFQIKGLSDQFSFVYLSSIIKQIITVFKKRYIKKIFIASNKYHNTMSQHPQIISLIPFKPIFDNEIDATKHWDYIYEPNPKHLLDILINRYLYSQIYLNILENLVCEQAARMIAMRTATDNSDNLIKELQLVYNKIRQSNITKELTEIVSGASAIALN